MRRGAVLCLVFVACAAGALFAGVLALRPAHPGAPIAVEGCVVDGVSGQPVEGAVVTVQLTGAPLRTATSGADGRFTLKRLFPGRYRLSVQKEPYRRSWTPLAVPVPGPLVLRLTTREEASSPGTDGPERPRPTTWPIRGEIRDAEGRPVAGASLQVLALGMYGTLTRRASVERAVLTPDAQGSCSIDLALGRDDEDVAWYLVASAPGFVSASRSTSPQMNVLYRFTLRPGGRAVEGRVLEFGTERGVADAVALLRAVPDLSGSRAASQETLVAAFSGADGAYRAPALDGRVGSVTYMAAHEAYPPAQGSFGWSPGSGPHRQDFFLLGGGVLYGAVLDSRTRRPVPGCLVLALDREQVGWSRRATTDAEGRYALKGVPFDLPLVLRFEADGYVKKRMGDEERIVVPVSERVRKLDVPIECGGAITGTVSDSAGRPIAGASLKAMSRDDTSSVDHGAASRKDGSFAIRELEQGARWTVEARHPQYAPAWLHNVPAGDGGSVHITLQRGGAIAGRVLFDPPSPERPPVTVYVHRADEPDRGTEEFADVTIDAEGNYLIDRLNAGRYRVEVRDSGRMNWEPVAACILEADVTLESVTWVADVVLAARGSLKAKLRVAVPEGTELTGRVRLRLRPADRRGTWQDVWFDQSYQGSDEFELPHLSPGQYDAVVYVEPLGSSAMRRVTVSSSGAAKRHDFDVQEGLQIAGVVRDSRGRPVDGALVDVFDPVQQGPYATSATRSNENISGNSARSAADGTFRVTGLSAGEYRLMADHPTFAILGKSIGVPAAGPLEIVLADGAELTLAVRDRTGRPVPQASAQLTYADALLLTLSNATGADGVARFAQLPAGRYQIVVGWTGLRQPLTARLELAAGEKRSLLLSE